jgi:integrator complex subunit 1
LAALTTLCIFLAISSGVCESASLVACGDLREMELFLFFMLEADNQEIFDMVLRLTAYHYPENIVLPQGIQACNLILICHKLIFFTLGYTPPNLAVSKLYWKAWLMLLMLIAHNPGSLGSEAWNSFPPILRALMEMCITNDFATSSGTTDQTELQVAAIEKQTILEFETDLGAASTKTVITENNSLLLSQVFKALLTFDFLANHCNILL